MDSKFFNDEEIAKKLQSKDIPLNEKNYYFEQLVEKYKTKITSLVYNIGKPDISLQDAQEIAIETFLKFYQNIQNLKTLSSVQTYIYRIAINLTKNFLKSKRSKTKKFDIISIEELQQELTEKHNFEQEIINSQYEQEIKEIISIILNSLPEKQKIALQLALYEKMSYKQIAQVLNTTTSSVESLLFRAKQNIKKYILQHKEIAKKLNINLEQ